MHKAQFGEVESIKKPPHYEAIHQLALDIVNAPNKQQEWAAYNKIKEICDKLQAHRLIIRFNGKRSLTLPIKSQKLHLAIISRS